MSGEDFCARCHELEADCDCYATDSDDWSGMTRMQRIDYLDMQLTNGNNKDAANFLMHDGDVRADSVRLAMDIVGRHILTHPGNPDSTLHFIDRLNRLIDIWETA